MQLSDYIQIASIIASLLISVVSISIAVKTLKQNQEMLENNKKMLENTFRPYITIYGTTTNFDNPSYYIVLKNCGQSSALITQFKCDTDLTPFAFAYDQTKNNFQKPFENILNTYLAPNQSFIFVMDLKRAINGTGQIKGTDKVVFDITYSWNSISFSESIVLNLKAHYLLGSSRANNPNKLKTISYALQDLVEKKL